MRADITASTGSRQSQPARPLAHPCPCCGGRMFIIEPFQAGSHPRHRPTASLGVIRIDSS